MWGWQIAVYLFLGGLAAGTFFFGALLQLAFGTRYLRTVRLSSALAVLFLLLGLVFLLIDVARPLRALDLVHSFSNLGDSWMARGAWIIVAALADYALFFLVSRFALGNDAGSFIPRNRGWILNIIGMLGMLLSLLLAAYTGLLLRDAFAVSVWRTALIPALFVVSALETGLAVVITCLRVREMPAAPLTRLLPQFEGAMLVFFVMEFALIVRYAIWLMDAGASAAFIVQLLHEPRWIALFAGVAAVLILAAAASVVALVRTLRTRRDGNGGAAAVLPTLSLAGGFLLRACVLALGVEFALQASFLL